MPRGIVLETITVVYQGKEENEKKKEFRRFPMMFETGRLSGWEERGREEKGRRRGRTEGAVGFSGGCCMHPTVHADKAHTPFTWIQVIY